MVIVYRINFTLLTAVSLQQCAGTGTIQPCATAHRGVGIVILRSKTCVGNESGGRKLDIIWSPIMIPKAPIGNTGVRKLCIKVVKLL